MEQNKKVVINDGGVDKTFIISRMDCWSGALIINDILKLISHSAGGLPVATIKQLIHNQMQTGVVVEGAGDINQLTLAQIVEIIFDLLIQVVQNLDRVTFENLADSIIPNITFKNSELSNIKLTTQSSDAHFTLYISRGVTLHKLIIEALKWEFADFFPKSVEEGSLKDAL